MKKLLLLLLICFLISPLCLFADDAEDSEIAEGEDVSGYDYMPQEKSSFRVKDRRIEIGFLHTRIGFANNFLSTNQIFQEKMIIDLDGLKEGFKVNLDIGVTPLFFNYVSENKSWGYGLSIGVDSMGILNLSGDMLTLSEANDSKSDVSGAAFVDFKVSSFFSVKQIKTKFKANMSVFVPVLYVDPDISYTLRDTKDATIVDMDYKIRVYTPMSIEDGVSDSITPTPGVDLHLGAEYPLAEVLGLRDKISFLDFIVGVDLINIPFVPASMSDYMEMTGKIGKGNKIDIENFDDFIDTEDQSYGSKRKDIYRPFKFLTWADWKPFEEIPVSFIPTLGFSVNTLYNEPGSLEAGIKARLDLANLFIASIGTGYYDRLWKNSLDIILNFRFFEFNIGVDLRSQDFLKSWTGSGFGVNLGFKFGG